MNNRIEDFLQRLSKSMFDKLSKQDIDYMMKMRNGREEEDVNTNVGRQEFLLALHELDSEECELIIYIMQYLIKNG